MDNCPEKTSALRGTEENPDSLITRVWGDFVNKFNGPARVREELTETVSGAVGLNFGRTASLCYAMNKDLDEKTLHAYN